MSEQTKEYVDAGYSAWEAARAASHDVICGPLKLRDVRREAGDVVAGCFAAVAALPMIDTEALALARLAIDAGSPDLAAARLIDAAYEAELAQWLVGWNAAPKEEQVYYSGHGGTPVRSWEEQVVRLDAATYKKLWAARNCIMSRFAPDTMDHSGDYAHKFSSRYESGCCARDLGAWLVEAMRLRECLLFAHDEWAVGGYLAGVAAVWHRREKARGAAEKAADDLRNKLFDDFTAEVRKNSRPSLFELFGGKPKSAEELRAVWLEKVAAFEQAEECLRVAH